MYCERKGCWQTAPEGSEYCSQKCKDAVAAETKRETDRVALANRRDAVSEETGRYLAPNADVGAVHTGGGLSKGRKETNAEREKRLEADRLGRAKREAEREKLREERNAARPKGNTGGQQDKGGNGTSRKARQAAKRRHQGSDFFHGSGKGTAVKQKK